MEATTWDRSSLAASNFLADSIEFRSESADVASVTFEASDELFESDVASTGEFGSINLDENWWTCSPRPGLQA